MGTRAVYSFIGDGQKFHVYKHWDNYPTGAAEFIANALAYAWDLPRFEPDEFAASFVAANKQKGEGYSKGGDLRLIAAPHSAECNKAARNAACDIEYRYEISCIKGKLHVKCFSTNYWDEIKENQLKSGTLEQFTTWAKREEAA